MCFSGTDLLKAEADESQLKSERCTLKIRPDFLELFSHKQVWQCLDSDEMMSKYVKVTQEIFTVINTTLFTKLRRFFSLEVKCLTVQDLRGCILICLKKSKSKKSRWQHNPSIHIALTPANILWHQCCFHRCTRRLWDAYSVRAYHKRKTLAVNCLLCHEDPCGPDMGFSIQW